MSRKDIIAMAREAYLYEDGQFFVCRHDELERFADLVAAAAIKNAPDYKMGYADGVAAEREACAKVGWMAASSNCEDRVAAAIRARGNA